MVMDVSAAEIVPREQRCPFFREVVFDLCAQLSNLASRDYDFVKAAPNLVLRSLAPWLLTSPQYGTKVQHEQERLLRAGFDGEKYVQQLKAILGSDPHLEKCCRFDIHLARYVNQIGDLLIIDLIGNRKEECNDLWDTFEKQTYESGQFARIAYTHIFNFATSRAHTPVRRIRNYSAE